MNSSLTSLPNGVLHVPLKSFVDSRGSVLKMLSVLDSFPFPFGEIYFSTTNPNCSKGWKLHKRFMMACSCVHGSLNLYMFDNRIASPTRNLSSKLTLSPGEHSLLIIPPKIWYGFESNSTDVSILSVVLSSPHDPTESLASSELVCCSPTTLDPI